MSIQAIADQMDDVAPAGPGRIIASASDADAASAALTSAYNSVTVMPPCGAPRVSLRLQSVALPNLHVGDLHISKATVRAEDYPQFTVCLPIAGNVRISSSVGETAIVRGHSGAVVSPDDAVLVEYLSDDCSILTLAFEPSAINAELSAMLGYGITSPVRFDMQLADIDHTPFARAVQFVRGELERPNGLTTLPAMSARLGGLIMAGLLSSQPSNYFKELTRPRGVPGPRAIRTAVALIEDEPARITTVADIAKAVGLSVRALENGFRRHVGTSPMAYLRDVRLARAHGELVIGDPDLTTATDVASNWGFWHYGRFAAAYRRRYGCTPSETLRAKTA
jgi:AraC-like DNA-binding protein